MHALEIKAIPKHKGKDFTGKQQGMTCGRLSQHSTSNMNANE